jgi:hypothetical protein
MLTFAVPPGGLAVRQSVAHSQLQEESMQATPLTPREVVNLVARQVRQFEEVGLTRDAAVLMCAFTLKVEPYKVAALAPPSPSEQS